MLLPGGEGLGDGVSHGHPVALPGPVRFKPAPPGGLLVPVGLDLLLRPWVFGEGVLFWVGEVLDPLDLLLRAARRRIW